jgi:hypothetical protein
VSNGVDVVGRERHRPVLQARRLVRRRRWLAPEARRRRSDPDQPHPRGEQPFLAGQRHRPGSGGYLQRHPRLSRWKTPPPWCSPSPTGPGHALGRRRLGPQLGTDLTGKHQLPDLPRRGRLPHRRDHRLAVGPMMRLKIFPGTGPGGRRSTPRPRPLSAATLWLTKSRTSRRRYPRRSNLFAAAATASRPSRSSTPWSNPPAPASRSTSRPDRSPGPVMGGLRPAYQLPAPAGRHRVDVLLAVLRPHDVGNDRHRRV